jgi:hypothetical protein
VLAGACAGVACGKVEWVEGAREVGVGEWSETGGGGWTGLGDGAVVGGVGVEARAAWLAAAVQDIETAG